MNQHVEELPSTGAGGFVRRGAYVHKSFNGSITEGYEGTDYTYPTLVAAIRDIHKKSLTFFTTRDETYNSTINYTSSFNSWLHTTGFMFTSNTTKNHAKRGSRDAIFEVGRIIRWSSNEGTLELKSYGFGDTNKLASNRATWAMFMAVKAKYEELTKKGSIIPRTRESIQGVRVIPVVQMETPTKETAQGDVSQGSDKHVNTIITRDQTETVSEHDGSLDTVSDISSSEPSHKFQNLTSRWMPLDSVKVTTSNKLGDNVKTLYLPEALYSTAKCAPNLAPFEAFIYGRMDIELRVVANANKFHCGKLLVSSKYDSYQADAFQAGYQSGLARNHVIVDLSANNEGVLQVPFRYHRPWLRLVKNDNNSAGVRSSKYCSIYCHVLSPLQTGSGGSSEINFRLFYRFKKIEFTGMSYRVTVQGLGFEDVVTPTTSRALREILKGAENAFDQLGRNKDLDKPSTVNGGIVIPRPRLNFGTGKGLIDVAPLRVNPHTLTNYHKIAVPTDEPKTFYDLARIWGVKSTFAWSAQSDTGTEIANMVIDPMCRSYTEDYYGEPTPLEYACGQFMFWSGPIELRFDFVSNSFHTGTVQISAEFGRKTTSTSECESSSTYTKMFHLGEQKSVSFRIPYIYDTVMRRTTADVWHPMLDTASDSHTKYQALTIAPESQTFVKVKVINKIVPVATAPQSIDVLVFIRAGKNFCMHGLKGNTFRNATDMTAMNDFPRDFEPKVSKREVPKPPVKKPTPPEQVYPLSDPYGYQKRRPHDIPADKRNEYGEWKPECIPMPIVQMDNGEKEDEDDTDNFSEGQCAGEVQTLDIQMSFKDILRRPCLILDRQKVQEVVGGGFFIPLMPPNKTMCYIGNTAENNIWAQSLWQNSSVAIMDMFRAWRGGMRYTIVVNSGTKPIYVSLVPHSGVRIIGNKSIFNREHFPLYGSNFTTEIICPTVNPTAVIEAPYETENTWSLTFEENPARDYTWRDKGDFNSGHLCIQAQEECNITVFWSAADDFEVANFYGIPYSHSNGWAYRWNDAQAKVQMDFCLNDLSTSVGQVVKEVITPRNVARALASQIPVIGPSLAIGTLANKVDMIENEFATVSRSVSSSGDRMATAAERMAMSVESVQELLKSAVSQASNTLSGLINASSVLYDFLLDMIIAWYEQSWVVVGVSMVRFISKMFPNFVINGIMQYAHQLADCLKRLFTRNVPQTQADVSPESTILGILVGIIGTVFGVVLDPRRTRSFSMGILERVTSSSGASYLMNILRFIQSTFETVRTLIMEALGYVSPQAVALKMLSEKNTQINEFIKEAQIMTSEFNGVLIQTPQFRHRMWKTILQAHQVQRIICQVPSNCVSSQLSRLCSDVIKFGNEKFVDLSASPVRFEPYVISIEGSAGVGKSHCTEALVQTMLESIGFQNPSSNNVYYRTAGEKFWSGYRDQPVIVYDEWLNTTDPTRCTDQIAEMMKLKSTAMFIPEMAHLDEKKIRGNPLVIIILTNNAFTNISDYAVNVDAVFRRRDLVLKAERTPEYSQTNLRHKTQQELADLPHLRFKKYIDVLNYKRGLTKEWKTFRETEQFVVSRFKQYYEKEKEMVTSRMNKLPQFAAQSTGQIRLEDPFTLFYELNTTIQSTPTLSQNGWTPYEQMETAATLLARAIEQHENTVVEPIAETSEIEWDTPEVQGLFTGVAGHVIRSRLFRSIMRAGAKQLQVWEMSFTKLRTTLAQCTVCLAEVECSYTCASTYGTEALHHLCLSCHSSVQVYGDKRCPTCRDTELVPSLGVEEIRAFTVWSRMSYLLCKGTNWLMDRILRYYNFQEACPMASLMLEFILGVCNSHFSSGNLTAHMSNVAIHTINEVVQYESPGSTFLQGELFFDALPTTQSDDWDDDTVSVPLASTSNTDVFTVSLNHKILDNYFEEPVSAEVCLHSYVSQVDYTTQIVSEHWRIADVDTSHQILVPLRPCDKNCTLTREQLITSLESYLKIHNKLIRGTIIDYASKSGNLVGTIPDVFKPSWMIPIVEPTLASDWWNYLSGLWEEYKYAFTWIAGVSVVVAGLMSAYNLSTGLLGIGVQSSVGSADPNASPRHRRSGVTKSSGERRYFQAAEESPSVLAVVEKYIVQNMTRITIYKGKKSVVIYGIGVFHKCLLIPRHYVKELRKALCEGLTIEAWPTSKPQLKTECNFTNQDFTESDSADLAYVCMPASFPIYKDLRKFMSTESDWTKVMPSEGILLAVPGKNFEYPTEILVDIYDIVQEQRIEDQNQEYFTVSDALRYNYSRPGACGSLLLRRDHQRPILSMHFAGSGDGHQGYGYGVILTQESLGHLSVTPVQPKQVEDLDLLPITQAKFVFDDNVKINYLGAVPPHLTPFIPRKSKLVKSLLYGVKGLETIMEPAILDKTDNRYMHESTPLYEGVKKHGVLTLDFTAEEIKVVAEQYWDGWLMAMKPLVIAPKILTTEEAIVGIPGIEHYKGIDLNKSAGYPFICTSKKTKSDYVTVIRDEALQIVGIKSIHKELQDVLESKRLLRSKGIIPATIFVDTLKDEKRKKEKLMAVGGTRVFCNSPFDYVIECRRFFMHFIASFMSNRRKLLHGVGINPMSSEWSELTRDLLRKNSKFITIDYTNFGPGYNAGVAEAAYELMIKWCKMNMHITDENELHMRVIVWECIQSYHVASNTIYHQCGGSPSGAVFTTIVNTMVNILYVLLAWQKIVGPTLREKNLPPVKVFKKHVELVTYGDDLIMTVTDEYIDIFNAETIAAYFKQHQIVATNATKTETIVPWTSIGDASFLKRGFTQHPTREREWLAPLNWESIVSATQWVWRSADLKGSTVVNCEAALLQAHSHGKEKFDDFKQIVNRALIKNKMEALTSTWEEVDNIFFTTGLMDELLDSYINY